MQLRVPGGPLEPADRECPEASAGQVRLRVSCCGVCRTDLHIVDGELPPMTGTAPLVPGHEIVGYIDALGTGVTGLARGTRVGVGWLGSSCGHCRYCVSGRENLCQQARFTGYHHDGGYAQYALVDARYVIALPDDLDPDRLDDAHLAPLLCAGLIGYRAYRAAGDARNLGLYGFGAAAHILTQIAVAQGRSVFAFTRAGDIAAQDFARTLGAAWAGASTEAPPAALDAAILFAPDGSLVPRALAAVAPGGIVVCAGIYMSDIPSFAYQLLWQERRLVSIANLTRADARDFFAVLAQHPVRTAVEVFDLADANEALARLRAGSINGAAVLRVR